MKNLIVVAFLVLFTGTASAQEGVEAGDKEVSFMGMYLTSTGDTDYSFGNITLRFGYYFTDKLLVGISPGINISTFNNETDTDFSGELFFAFNFISNAKTIPYVKASFYQSTFDIPEGMEFRDYSYVQVGLGFKVFFNEYMALDTSGSYGFSLAEDSGDGILMFLSGITFIF